MAGRRQLRESEDTDYRQSRSALRGIFGARAINASAPQAIVPTAAMSNSAWADTFKNTSAGTQGKALAERIAIGDPNPARNISSSVLDRFTSGTAQASPLQGLWGNVANTAMQAPDKLTEMLLNPQSALPQPQFSFMPAAQPSAAPSFSDMAAGGANNATVWDRVATSKPVRVGAAGSMTTRNLPDYQVRDLTSPYGRGSSALSLSRQPSFLTATRSRWGGGY